MFSSSDWLNGLKEKPIISKITEILYNRKSEIIVTLDDSKWITI